MLRALLAVPLLLLLALVLLQYGSQVAGDVGRDGVNSTSALAVALAVAIGLLFSAVIKRTRAWNPPAFLLCSLIATSTIYYAYIASIEVVWVNDFQTMWQHAVAMVASGDYTVRSIYDGRALPVLVPTILLFGPNPAVVPLVNLVFLLGIQLLGYDLARRIAGHRAAQGFVVLWGAAMEPILALPITSHDIWGLFFLVVFLWGFRATCDRLTAGKVATPRDKMILAGCVLGLALALTLLDMQREITPFVILAFALGCLLMALKGKSAWSLLKPAFRLAVAAFLLYGGISIGLKHGHYMQTTEQGEALAQIRVGAYSSSLSDGTYRQGRLIKKTFFDQLDGDARREFVNAIPLSDLALQPAARLGNILYRAPEQARLGSQAGFYQAQATTQFSWLVQFTRAYNACYSVLLALLSLWLIRPLLRRLESLDGLMQLALLSTVVGGLLFVGESQPRYVFPLWFILPQLIAFAVVLLPEFAHERVAATSIWGWDITRGVLLLVAAYFLLAISVRWVYGESRGRILSGWEPALQGAAEQAPRDWFDANQKLSASRIKQESRDRRTTGFGDLALVMKIPVKTQAGGGVSASKLLCAGTDRRALDFFYYMPYQNPDATAAFTLEVRVDGEQRWSVPLPGTPDVAHAHLVDILPAGTCGKLEFNLRTNLGIASASWIRASQTDLYFVRLAR